MRSVYDQFDVKGEILKHFKIISTFFIMAILIYSFTHGLFMKAIKEHMPNGARVVMAQGLPICEYVRNVEKKDISVQNQIMDDIYPIKEYARDKQVTDEVVFPTSDAVSNPKAGEANLGQGKEEIVDKTQNESKSTKENKENETSKAAEVISRNLMTGTVYPKANLVDFDFVFKNFYTVTSITELGSDKLRPSEFLKKDMTVAHDASTPQILIFHTHSQEDFVDSVKGDESTTIVGVGDYLTEILSKKYGYNVIHDRSVYDLVDGELDRSKAYTYAEQSVAKILRENPSIDVVIDLHRDGVADDTHLVSEINGKQTAKVMFFNGLSYSKKNGDITYLPNPYRDDNLALSLQMQLLGNAYYPGYLRRIYVNAYRYCLHMRGKSMLIEAGAQTNTVEEVKNAMEPLADLMDKTLRGEKYW